MPRPGPLWRIVGAYAAGAGLWILASDTLVARFAGPDSFLEAQLFKGLSFVAVTSALLWLVLRGQLSERRRSEARLEETRSLLERTFGALDDAIFEVEIGTRVIRWMNPAAERLLGYSRSEVVGKTTESIHPSPEDFRSFEERARADLERDGIARLEHRLRRADGRVVETEHTVVVGDPGGEPAVAVSIVRDISRRKAREASLERAARELEALLANVTDVIATIDRDGSIGFLSPSVKLALDRAPDELEGRDVFELVHPEDRTAVLETMNRAWSRPGKAERVDLRIRHRDGSWRSFDAVGVLPVGWRWTRGLVITARDTTERRRAEAVLEEGRRQLEQSRRMEAIGRLAGGVAHDFNNLLTVILGNAEVAAEVADPELAENLDEIRGAAERAAALTRQLLAFSRRQPLNPRPLSLDRVAVTMEGVLGRLLGERIEVRTEARSEGAVVVADPAQVEQMVLDCAVNARDAMPDGGTLLLTADRVEFDDELVTAHETIPAGSYVRLRIADTGIGIDPEVLPRVFEPFFTTKESHVGSGLGLASVFGAVHQHAGHVVIESTPGRGTAVDLYFPRAEERSDDEGREVREPARASRGHRRILVAEDERAVRTLVERVLSRAGYEVMTAADGEDALAIAAGSDLDLLVTDVVMPGIGGAELARELAGNRTGLKVLFVSGYPAGELRDLDDAPGVDYAFLGKPFSAELLLEEVRRLLGDAG